MLNETDYQSLRAICDKADAYWKANATGNSMSAELAAHPDYAACTNEMRGRVEQFEILRDMPEIIGAYMSQTREQREGTNYVACRLWNVTTWTGNILGTAQISSSWSTPKSFVGSRMYQFKARIGGREYTGRGYGEGMSIVFRETAASKRKRAA